jgi:hypothetical protein
LGERHGENVGLGQRPLRRPISAHRNPVTLPLALNLNVALCLRLLIFAPATLVLGGTP